MAGRESGTAFNSMLAQVHIVSDFAIIFWRDISPTSLTSLCFLFQVLQKPTNDKKQGLVAASRKVADCLGALVKSAEALKGKNGERMLVVLFSFFVMLFQLLSKQIIFPCQVLSGSIRKIQM